MSDPQLDRIEKKLDRINYWIEGNGQEGAKVRLARLEGTHKLVFWMCGIVVAALVINSLAQWRLTSDAHGSPIPHVSQQK